MVHAIRNLGWPGISATAIAAVDVAAWDLKAKLLGVCVADSLGRAREAVPIYGSGGLTSYPEQELCAQLQGWVQQGIPRVKMKVGRDPDADVQRARGVRRAIGEASELYVDANGAYSRKQALRLAQAFAELGVSWLEEPVSSDDLDGLRLLRDSAPPGMDIAAGEYGYEPMYFRRMLDAQAVDVLQADVTRACGHHRPADGRFAVHGGPDAVLGPLRPADPRPCCRLDRPTSPHRVLPHSRSGREAAV